MKKKSFVRYLASLCIIIMLFSLSSCGWFGNKMKNIKGELIGNDFTISFYDHFGTNTQTIYGDKVGLQSNYVSTVSIDSEGVESTNYEMSSVITMTIDGNEAVVTGDTIIFAEDGLEKLEDFSVPEEIVSSGGTINILDRNINKLQNLHGTAKIVVVCSQLGVPIAVYGGDSVYWEIPDDLPKTTKLLVDGKALYIYRATYRILDTALIP